MIREKHQQNIISRQWADIFAVEWVESWNNHDLSWILSHYTYDFEMNSPLIVEIAGVSSGSLIGKVAIATYWQTAFQKVPDLHFKLIGIYVGVSSIVIHYRSSMNRSVAEVMFLNHAQLIYKAVAHYLP